MSATHTTTETVPAVDTKLTYFKALTEEPPWVYAYEHEPNRNFGEDPQSARIQDIRGHESEYTLDRKFIVHHPQKKISPMKRGLKRFTTRKWKIY